MITFTIEVYGPATVQATLDVAAETREEAEAIAIIRAGKLRTDAWSIRAPVSSREISLTGEYIDERHKQEGRR